MTLDPREFRDIEAVSAVFRVVIPNGGGAAAGRVCHGHAYGGVCYEEVAARTSRGGTQRWSELIHWPYRVSGAGGGFYSDVARVQLVARPSDEKWVTDLRSRGLVQGSDTVVTIERRHVWEDSWSAHNATQWISGLRGQIARIRRPVIGQLMQMYVATPPGLSSLIRARKVVGGLWNDLQPAINQNWAALTGPIRAKVGSVAGAVDAELHAAPLMDPLQERERLKSLAESILRLPDTIRRSSDVSSQADWEAFIGQACELGRRRTVATYDVVENEIFEMDGSDQAPERARVIDFDYRMGYLARPDDRAYIDEGDQLFVRVHGVPSGQSVGVRLGAEIVSTTRAERGLDGMGLPSNGVVSDTQPDVERAVLRPMDDGGPASSLIMRVGRVSAGEYRFSLCEPGSTGEGCEALGGAHSLTVQGSRRWGFRAGFGMNLELRSRALGGDAQGGRRRVQASRIEGAGSYVVTSSDQYRPRFSLPFLFTVYLKKRQLHRSSWELGLVTGFNLLRPTRDFYVGAHVGGGPVGVTLAYTLSRVDLSNAPDGAVVESERRPNLNELFGTRAGVSHGLLIALTFDFDVFRRLYDAVKLGNLPGIGGGT